MEKWNKKMESAESEGERIIKNAADETRVIWWNVSSPRFCCYVDKTDGDSFKYVQLWSLEGGATPVENEVMPWYTEGTGNQAIHIEGAGIWTWVKYGDMGYENYNAFNAEKDNFEVSYESEPATTARIDASISTCRSCRSRSSTNGLGRQRKNKRGRTTAGRER